MRSALSRVLPLLALGLLGTGCPFGDPGRSISGEIDLGASQDASGFVQLEIRAFASASAWTPADGVPAVDPQYSASLPLAGITFPYDYDLWALGTVPQRSYRVVAWLSRDATSLQPASGAPWGTRAFQFDGCGSFGDYCEDQDGVDLTLDQVAP